jgi:hypothetical protein
MEIYNVGPEELSTDYDLLPLFNMSPQPVWVVYWREEEGYGQGNGKCIYKQGETFYEADLGTCSCYPISDGFPGWQIDIEQWIANGERIRSEVYTNQYDTLLLDKVKELL